MSALAVALAYLGTLAFIAWVLWLRRNTAALDRAALAHGAALHAVQHSEALEKRVARLELEPSDLAQLRDTVDTLSLAAGLKRAG